MKNKETPLSVKLISIWFYVLSVLFLFGVLQSFLGILFTGYYKLLVTLLVTMIYFSFFILAFILAVKLRKGKSWSRITAIIFQTILSLIIIWNISKIVLSFTKSGFTIASEIIIVYMINLGLYFLVLSGSLFTIFYLLSNRKAKEFFDN